MTAYFLKRIFLDKNFQIIIILGVPICIWVHLMSRSKGLILKPMSKENVKIDCYVVTRFAAFGNSEDDQDPYCV